MISQRHESHWNQPLNHGQSPNLSLEAATMALSRARSGVCALPYLLNAQSSESVI
jgi:hypothetical protein